MLFTGDGEFQYEVVHDWAKLPPHVSIGDVADVGVDQAGYVYLFSRGEHSIIVLDSNGCFVRTWGTREQFPRAHGLTVGLDGTLWLTDIGNHTARQYTTDGELLLTLDAERPAAPLSGRPFNQCTHVAVHPASHELYVSDGYANASIHKFDPDGTYQFSWGEPGNQPGQFFMPHNICCGPDGNIFVADRQNARVQVFSSAGALMDIWYGMALPSGLASGTVNARPILAMVELSSAFWAQEYPATFDAWNVPGIGPKVSLWQFDGTRVATLCDNGFGSDPAQLSFGHGIAMDAAGNIYVAQMPSLSPSHLRSSNPPGAASLKYLRRIGTESINQ